MAFSHRKSRVIASYAGRMFALLEEMQIRCIDPVFKSSARRMVREIKHEAGEPEDL